jgi:hypothetical protein
MSAGKAFGFLRESPKEYDTVLVGKMTSQHVVL